MSRNKDWDINDSQFTKLQVRATYDSWEELPDGHCRFIYSHNCEEAKKHTSGWAMRNTNNHNVNILKKSCLGVLVCSKRCIQRNGKPVAIRPAICDKARKKQQGKICPNLTCDGYLEIQPCRGHCGYPVTHFWRHVPSLGILFQAKGFHDHPKPASKSFAMSLKRKGSQKQQHQKQQRSNQQARHDFSGQVSYLQPPKENCNHSFLSMVSVQQKDGLGSQYPLSLHHEWPEENKTKTAQCSATTDQDESLMNMQDPYLSHQNQSVSQNHPKSFILPDSQPLNKTFDQKYQIQGTVPSTATFGGDIPNTTTHCENYHVTIQNGYELNQPYGEDRHALMEMDPGYQCKNVTATLSPNSHLNQPFTTNTPPSSTTTLPSSWDGYHNHSDGMRQGDLMGTDVDPNYGNYNPAAYIDFTRPGDIFQLDQGEPCRTAEEDTFFDSHCNGYGKDQAVMNYHDFQPRYSSNENLYSAENHGASYSSYPIHNASVTNNEDHDKFFISPNTSYQVHST